jgi:hypothetical protein
MMEKNRHPMKRDITNPRTRLFVIGVVILLVGLAGSAVLYMTAGDDSDRVEGYEMAGGNVYPVAPENSKTYIHDLEVFGGKSAVLSDAFRRRFAALWHGKSLAFTIAFGTVLLATGFFFVAGRLPSDLNSDPHDEERRGGSRSEP